MNWLVIDSVKGLFLRHHHLPSSHIEVAVFSADQKPGDDDQKRVLLPFYSWEILLQRVAQFLLKELNQCSPLLTLNLPIFGKTHQKF